MNIVIIGNGVSGFYAASNIKKQNADVSVKVITNEGLLSYYRPLIAECISSDELNPNFYLAKKEFYEDNDIDVILNTKIDKINTSKKYIECFEGQRHSYDKLIIASGGNCIVPPIAGSEKENVLVLKNYQDAMNIKNRLYETKNVVIVGGGLLGLETACELKEKGLNVTVLQLGNRLIPKQIDEEGGKILELIAKEKGINLILNDTVYEIIGDKKVKQIKLNSQRVLDCDMLIFSIGIKPDIEIAKKAGIETDRGIVVNERMQTSAKDVYACGDVAQYNGVVFGNWAASMQMGKVSGLNAISVDAEFKMMITPLSLDIFGYKVYSIGTIFSIDDMNYEALGFKDVNKKIYKKLFFKNDILIGAVYINDNSNSDNSKTSKISSMISSKKSKNEVLQSNMI